MSTLRTAILHHLADSDPGAEKVVPHFDWLVEIRHTRPENRDVPTWRVPVSIETLPPGGSCSIQRIHPHRGQWLEQRSVIRLDEGRGIVSPHAQGTVKSLHQEPQQWIIEIQWNTGQSCRYRMDRPEEENGMVERLSDPKVTS